MKILSHVNVNLHSASTPGGLIHVLAGTSRNVPNDVMDHPIFDLFVNAGSIVVLKSDEENAEADRDAEIARMLADNPGYESLVSEARISGSPLHLVAANIAKQEAVKNEQTNDDPAVKTEDETSDDKSEAGVDDSDDELDELDEDDDDDSTTTQGK